jgi:pimeloyl-ACP methyl ester carboxylesterase
MQQFERGGYVLDVRDHGDPAAPAVVLLHGFPQDGGAWDEVALQLQEAGYRTLVPDMRGVSPRARPRSSVEYRFAESLHDTVALLDAAGLEQAHIVGHDWGGAVAWAMASEHPDRMLTMTSVSTPHPLALAGSMVRSPQALQAWYAALFQLPYLPEALLAPGRPLWRAMVRGLPREDVARYADRLADRSARSAALGWYRMLPRELAAPSVRWAPVSLPTLYVWGDRDPALGRAAAEATASYVTGPYRFEVVRAGHWIPETRPALLGSLLTEHLGSA